MIRQLVLLKTKQGVTQTQIDDAHHKTSALFKTMKQPKVVEYGNNVATFGMDQGFNIGYVITLDSVEDMESFVAYPDHVKLNEEVW